MSKLEKGILGYRKDPKNQILFSFGVRPGEEWPSDDSDDSDYSPGNKTEERPSSVKPTKKPRKDAKSKRGRSSVESSNSEDESAQSDSSDTIIESTIISECNINKNLNRAPILVKSSQNSVHLKGQKPTTQTVSKAKQESVSLSPSSQNTTLDATDRESANHVSPSASSHLESGFSETSSSCLESTQGSPPTVQVTKKEKKSEKAKRKKHKLPSLEEESSHKKKKRKREKKEGSQNKTPRKRRYKAAAVAPVEYKEGQEGISSAQNFPPELLLKIFRLVVSKQGAIPFLCRAARVCKLWYHTSCNPSLWMNLDLSYGWIKSQERYLIWLSTHRIPLCTSINLSGWKLLTFNGIQALAESCPNLTSINLSQCSKISSKAVQLLADHCPMLTKIDLSATSTEAVSQVTLKYLLERVGKSVTHLTLGNNTLKGFNSVLNCISSHCPNLEYLDVSSVFFSSDYLSFNVEKFQQGCPKLRVLRFVDAKVRASQATQREQVESPGFPDLEELSIAVNTNKNTYRLAMDGDALSRLLKNSSQLKTLDVRGWSFYSYRALIHIPATDVQQLLISQNHVPISQDFGFDLVMQKWRHSLVEVDLSWNSYRDDVLDQGLQILTEFRDECVVEALDLAGTNVECATVRTILNRCPRLRAVNLSSCRSLPRGIKREFEGDELQGLREAVEKFEKEES